MLRGRKKGGWERKSLCSIFSLFSQGVSDSTKSGFSPIPSGISLPTCFRLKTAYVLSCSGECVMIYEVNVF